VQVGHDLGIEIVAEGIERPEQLELLRAMGCGLGQGYLVARPMAAQSIESFAGAGGSVHAMAISPPLPDELPEDLMAVHDPLLTSSDPHLGDGGINGSGSDSDAAATAPAS